MIVLSRRLGTTLDRVIPLCGSCPGFKTVMWLLDSIHRFALTVSVENESGLVGLVEILWSAISDTNLQGLVVQGVEEGVDGDYIALIGSLAREGAVNQGVDRVEQL